MIRGQMVSRIISEKRAGLVMIGGLVLADVLLYGIGVYPLHTAVEHARTRAEDAADGRKAAGAALRGARAQLDGTTEAGTELDQFYGQVLPQDLAGARAITYPRLAALAGQMGLRLERRTSDRDREEDSQLGRLRTTLLLAGDYGSIREFIEALETAPEFLVIEDIALTQREEIDESLLALTLEISTYYRVDDGA